MTDWHIKTRDLYLSYHDGSFAGGLPNFPVPVILTLQILSQLLGLGEGVSTAQSGRGSAAGTGNPPDAVSIPPQHKPPQSYQDLESRVTWRRGKEAACTGNVWTVGSATWQEPGLPEVQAGAQSREHDKVKVITSTPYCVWPDWAQGRFLAFAAQFWSRLPKGS